MKKCQDVYMEPIVHHYDNCIVRVYKPILTEEERERRTEEIKKALVEFYIAVEREKRNNANNPTK